MKSDVAKEISRIEGAVALAMAQKPAYSGLYPFLEGLFLARTEIKAEVRLETPQISGELVAKKWENGFPLLNRWDFPIDSDAAAKVLARTGNIIPEDNLQMAGAFLVLSAAIPGPAEEKDRFWHSFLHHEMEPWEEWVPDETGKTDLASLLFLARSAVRPSLELTAEELLSAHSLGDSWLKGYCPVCGSFPSLLYLEGEGQRKAFCSWCATTWDLHRLQCPYCDNRYHESLGYLAIEAEPFHRISYCNLCRFYFKQIDAREFAVPPYLPLEEWTTLHLDLVAQREGLSQPPSPAPAVYGKET